MNYITNTQSDIKIMLKNMLIKVSHKLFEYFKEKS